MAKVVRFAAVYETMEEYRTTPLMMEFFFYGFINGKYSKTLGVPEYNPENGMYLTMCPGYAVTSGMAFQFVPFNTDGFQLSSATEAALVFPDITETTLIAYDVTDEGDIKELGRLVGEKTGPEVFAWAAGFYSSNVLPMLGVAAVGVAAYMSRKRLKNLLHA
jgi:hypothetical protein